MADITPDIRSVFETELNSITGLPPIGWENVNFSPSTSVGYLEPRLVPTRREPAVRGINPQLLYQGYYLIEVFTPSGYGPNKADTYASTLIDHFEVTKDISRGGTTVSIRYAERDLGIKEDAFYKVPVRIGYYTYN